QPPVGVPSAAMPEPSGNCWPATATLVRLPRQISHEAACGAGCRTCRRSRSALSLPARGSSRRRIPRRSLLAFLSGYQRCAAATGAVEGQADGGELLGYLVRAMREG